MPLWQSFTEKKVAKKERRTHTVVSTQHKRDGGPRHQALLIIQRGLVCCGLKEHVMEAFLLLLLQVEPADEQHVSLQLNVVEHGLLLAKHVVVVFEVGLDCCGATRYRACR
jgi:hypothetical protein